MKPLYDLPPDPFQPFETCFPLETDGYDRDSGKRSTIADRLHYALMDFAVPETLRPTFGPLNSDDDAFDAAYAVCELIMQSSRRADLEDAYVYFDEDEPALYFFNQSET
jgi:hypothetical protein